MTIDITRPRSIGSKATRIRTDNVFDKMYPPIVNALSAVHWSPLNVAKAAADFLASPGARILDIGSGAGKFCIAAGSLHPEATFYGIEHREYLVKEADRLRAFTRLDNVKFIYGNVMDIQSENFDHFYFYNSFCEQVHLWGRIDDTVNISKDLYKRYRAHFHAILNDKPPETRLVTYHTPSSEVPDTYKLVRNTYRKCLKFWTKI